MKTSKILDLFNPKKRTNYRWSYVGGKLKDLKDDLHELFFVTPTAFVAWPIAIWAAASIVFIPGFRHLAAVIASAATFLAFINLYLIWPRDRNEYLCVPMIYKLKTGEILEGELWYPRGYLDQYTNGCRRLYFDTFDSRRNRRIEQAATGFSAFGACLRQQREKECSEENS